MAGLHGIVDKWKEIEPDTKQQFYIYFFFFKKGNEPFGRVMAPCLSMPVHKYSRNSHFWCPKHIFSLPWDEGMLLVSSSALHIHLAINYT